MKKSVMLVMLFLVLLSGCSSTNVDDPLSTVDLFMIIKDAGLPVGMYVDYTKDTDPNNVMGLTGQYIAKLSFEVTTINQYDPEKPIGGSIEIFANAKDAARRKTYVDGLGASSPMLAERSYVIQDVALLRMDKNVSASEAEKYYDALVGAKGSINTEHTRGIEAETTTNAVVDMIKETEKKKTATYDIGYYSCKTWTSSTGSKWMQTIIEVQNTGDTALYLGTGSYDIEDMNGQLLLNRSMISGMPQIISPGKSGYYYDETMIDVNLEPGNVNVIPRPKVLVSDVEKPNFILSGVEVKAGKHIGIEGSGQIENATGEVKSYIYIVIMLYNEELLPIGQMFTIITDDLGPGEKIGFGVSSYSMPPGVTISEIKYIDAIAYDHHIQF